MAAQTAYPLTATYSAQAIQVTETAQAQMILNAQATQAAQQVETLTAYPLTATPFAVTKAALLMQEYDREQQAFINRVVAPLIPIVGTLVLLLLVLLIVLAYRRWRYLPVLRPRRLGGIRANLAPSSLITIDGVMAEPAPRLHRIVPSELVQANSTGLPEEDRVQVEIVNATEPPVSYWIAEVEHQSAFEGGLPH